MRTYLISVICSDATTYSQNISAECRKEADAFADGVCSLYSKQGKSIFMKTVKFLK